MTDDGRWLRPRFRSAWHQALIAAALFWLHMTVIALALIRWWPDHPMLDPLTPETMIGSVVLTLTFAGPFLVMGLIFAPRAWRVGSNGIAIYRWGRLRQAYAWSEIGSIHIFRRYAVIRTGKIPFGSGQELGGLDLADVRWFEEFATVRLGARVIPCRIGWSTTPRAEAG